MKELVKILQFLNPFKTSDQQVKDALWAIKSHFFVRILGLTVIMFLLVIYGVCIVWIVQEAIALGDGFWSFMKSISWMVILLTTVLIYIIYEISKSIIDPEKWVEQKKKES